MAKHLELGQYGETLAVRYLAGKGLRICERNYRSGKGEIDIIARDGEWLVFIEVKTRTGTRYGLPREAVTAYKQEVLRRTAQAYRTEKDQTSPCRFDVVEILIRPDGTYNLEYLPAAF